MSGTLATWPDWPVFTKDNSEGSDDLVGFKRAIIDRYGEEALTRSWLKVCQSLERATDHIARNGSTVIPELDYHELFSLDNEKKEELKGVGCFVVRNVFSRTQADEWFRSLKEYVSDNEKNINGKKSLTGDEYVGGKRILTVDVGYPQPKPMMLNLYYSPAQIAARTHPNQLKLCRELNSWWHDDTARSSPEQLCYSDQVRIRQPKRPFPSLGPHIDAGSLCRWADPVYSSVYAAVFSGEPELLDNYDLSLRQVADQALFKGAAQSTVLRAFQGWTALTSAGPGQGSLMVFPDLKWGIAYVMLRPFFSEPQEKKDLMDASKWEFDPDTAWFPGTWRDDSQLLSAESHPHLRLKECLVSIPHVSPGDTVFWHADMVHAVEVEHNGTNDASVAYIAATPTTDLNKAYIKEQLQDFLAGRPPVDFRRGSSEVNFKGYLGEKAVLGGDDGRRAMGYHLLESV